MATDGQRVTRMEAIRTFPVGAAADSGAGGNRRPWYLGEDRRSLVWVTPLARAAADAAA